MLKERTYSCGIVQIELAGRARTIGEVMVKGIAEQWKQWSRLVVVHWDKDWREVNVGDISDDCVDEFNELTRHLSATHQSFLSCGIVCTRQDLV